MAGNQYGGQTPDQMNAALAAGGFSYRVPTQVASAPPGVAPTGDLAFPDAPQESLSMGPPVDDSLAFPNAPMVEPASGTDLVPPGSLGAQLYQHNQSAYQLQEPAVAPAVAVSGGPGALAQQPQSIQSVNPFQLRQPQIQRPGIGMPSGPYGRMAKEAGASAASELEQQDAALLQGDIAGAGREQALADQAEGSAETAAAAERVYGRMGDAERNLAAQNEAAARAQSAAADQRIRDIDQDSQDIEKFEVKDRRTSGQRAMSAIAIGLGELGAGISRAFGVGGQQNTALQIVNQQMDRDLDEQRAVLDNKKTALGAKQTALGLARQRYQDEGEARQFARVLQLSAFEKELEAAKAKGMGKDAMTVADGQIAALQQQRSELYANLHGSRYEKNVADKQQLEILGIKDQQAKAAAAAKAAAKAQENGYAFLGTNVQVANPEAFSAWSAQTKETEKEKMRKAIQGHAQYTSALQKMLSLKEQYGSEGRLWPTEISARYDALREQAINGANEMKDGNMLGDKEYARYNEGIPPAGDFAHSAVPKIQGLLEAADDKINATLGSIGARSVRHETLVRKGAAGGPAPTPSGSSEQPAPAPRMRQAAAPGQVVLSDAEEAKFQQDMQSGEGYRQWREQFAQKNGGAPVLDDPDYDYRAAWKAGIRPEPYGHDGGAYHWASAANGKMLKGKNHPTAWMEHFMQATGKDPNDLGIKSEADGKRYLAAHKGKK